MVVIITGGTRGIGKACAEVFEREGWDVVITSSKEDVRDYDMCRSVVKDAVDDYGKIDCLVNNAGIVRNKPFYLMSQEEWHDVIDVNLTGVFNMTKACLHHLMRAKGNVVNISSVAAIMGMRGQVNYSAAKAGVLGFTRALSREMAPFNVRVNALAVGLVETDMTKDDLLLSNKQEMVKCFIPMARPGQPIDVAEMVYFLATEKAKYITGDVIRIDGGLVTGDDG